MGVEESHRSATMQHGSDGSSHWQQQAIDRRQSPGGTEKGLHEMGPAANAACAARRYLLAPHATPFDMLTHPHFFSLQPETPSKHISLRAEDLRR